MRPRDIRALSDALQRRHADVVLIEERGGKVLLYIASRRFPEKVVIAEWMDFGDSVITVVLDLFHHGDVSPYPEDMERYVAGMSTRSEMMALNSPRDDDLTRLATTAVILLAKEPRIESGADDGG